LPEIAKATGRSTTPTIDALMSSAVDVVIVEGEGPAYPRIAVPLEELRLHLDQEVDRTRPPKGPERARMRRLQRAGRKV
jgi:hypothetical protein